MVRKETIIINRIYCVGKPLVLTLAGLPVWKRLEEATEILINSTRIARRIGFVLMGC